MNIIIFITILIAIILFYTCKKYNSTILLLISLFLYLYIAGILLFFILVGIIAVTFLFGLKINSTKNMQFKFYWLWSGIIINLIPLIFFKYVPFTHSYIVAIVGLSFYTFQAISYLADVYLEVVEVEKDLIYFSLYLSFFPKILQGPIERADYLIPQLKKDPFFDFNNLRMAFILILWGLFKKVVIADRLGVFVDQFYSQHMQYQGLWVILPIIFYTLQIYCDFSGYTDIALGIAKMFGINLTNNFNTPYFATSIADFWRRWHITLSKWLMDYLYKPISMFYRKNKVIAVNLALLVTFIICGIWHGSGINFLFWGLLNGLYIIFSNLTKNSRIIFLQLTGLSQFKHFIYIINIILTFILVSIAWIFFRANSLQQAFEIIVNILKSSSDSSILKFEAYDIYIITFSIIMLFVVDILKANGKTIDSLMKMNIFFRWPIYAILLFSIIFFSVETETKFLYFEF